MAEERQQQMSGSNKGMAFDGLSRSVHSAVTEHTGDSNVVQCEEEGYGGYFSNNQGRNSDNDNNDDNGACSSVANSCNNSRSSSSSQSAEIHEHDYIGLAGDSSSLKPDEQNGAGAAAEVPDLNLGLRLGPPKNKEAGVNCLSTDGLRLLVDESLANGSSSAGRLKLPAAGSKRGYSEAVGTPDIVKGMGSRTQLMPPMFPWSSAKPWRPNVVVEQPRSSFGPLQSKPAAERRTRTCTETSSVNQVACLNQSDGAPPSSSGPVVGWPPVQSFRKNTLVTTPQAVKSQGVDREALQPLGSSAEAQANGQGNSLYVKVYMDGVPIGRKVDLEANNSYSKLSSALKDMFSAYINGQNMPKLKPNLSSGEAQQQLNLFDGSEAEYVLTYEDKDGDLMLVGDVPWRMFAATVKRLRIMKGSDAIGLGVPKDSEDQTRNKAAS